MSELFDQIALTWDGAPWVIILGLLVVVGGIWFYFRDKKKRLKEYNDAK